MPKSFKEYINFGFAEEDAKSFGTKSEYPTLVSWINISPLALIETNNLQILPYSEIKFDLNRSKSLDVTLFRYSF